mgnify:CR=1 FL=1
MHFNALHKAKELRRFDFADANELQTLGELLTSADVVIEGSRPRALRAQSIPTSPFEKQVLLHQSYAAGRQAEVTRAITLVARAASPSA